MKQIDRLILKARQSIGVEVTLAMVERDGDSWAATVHLWDRVQRHPPTTESSTHATLDAALEHIHELAQQYPNSQDVPIIVDDIAG
jgi:hypothetical protein